MLSEMILKLKKSYKIESFVIAPAVSDELIIFVNGSTSYNIQFNVSTHK